MSVCVKCAVCGHENDVKRMFCIKCGYRLNPEGAIGRRAPANPRDLARGLGGIVRLVVWLAVAAALGLLFWPVTPQGKRGTNAAARSLRAKLQTLNTAAQAGQYVVEIVSEEEANGYLAALLARDAGATRSEGFRLALREINLSLQTNGVVLLVLANWGPVSLSYELAGEPRVGEKGFSLRVVRGRWGHLPLPPKAAEWVGGRVAVVFTRMAAERKVLDSLRKLELGKGRVMVATRG